MALILCLETSTTNCSVSLVKDADVISLKELNEAQYSHSENLHVFIKEVFHSTSFSLQDIDAVAVSMGPGSYTGLRIGVATAKGLCYALDKPLIALLTLEIMAHQLSVNEGEYILPLLDARRMEVYAAIFGAQYEQLRETKADIIDSDSFKYFLNQNKVHFIGPGAAKCREVIKHQNAVFYENSHMPSAQEMGALAMLKFQGDQFEDLAYFEPYYLKDFIISKKPN